VLSNDTEKALTEHEAKLDKAEVTTIREKITSLRELIAQSQSGEGVTGKGLKEKLDELQNASLNLFDQLYKARAAENSNQSGESEQKPDEAGEQKSEEKKP